MDNATYFLSQSQYNFLAALLPQPPQQAGRPVIPNTGLLNGVVYVLRTGCRWEDIPASTAPAGDGCGSGRSVVR